MTEFDLAKCPPDALMTKTHEWIRPDPDQPGIYQVGVTDFAAGELGDVVFVDLPDLEKDVTQFGKLGEIESVKAVSDLFAPVSGRVSAVNQALAESPELVNQDPYGGGWMLRIEITDLRELANLMTPQSYAEFLRGGVEH